MRAVVPIVLLGLPACAPLPPAPPPVANQEYLIAGEPDQVWDAVVQAYGDLGFPINNMDSDGFFLRSDDIQAEIHFQNEPLYFFITCNGDDQVLTTEVEFSVATTLREVGPDSTALRTQLHALGYAPAALITRPECTTRGVMEKRIADAAKARMGNN